MGGSALLSGGNADRLSNWLGQGPIQLSSLFAKVAGQTSVDFHAAADGRGATITLIEVSGTGLGGPFDVPILIGGYNPQPWSSLGAYKVTPEPADRTAFIFNLNENRALRQRLDGPGRYQTMNDVGLGPTFGAGYDLSVRWTLNNGHNNAYSYGTGDDDAAQLIAVTVGLQVLTLGQIEVFTVAAANDKAR